jgi:tetratricopeptide (TPR) repeat protein
MRAVLIAAAAFTFVACSSSPEVKRQEYLQSGKEHLAKKDYRRAVLAFQNAAKSAPKDPEPLYHLGVTALALGDSVSAAQFLDRALKLDPKYAAARLKLAEVLSLSRDASAIQHGAKLAEDALADEPGNLKALNILALTEMRSGNTQDAAGRLEEALRRFPSHLESAVNLARVRMAENDRPGAEEVLRQAIDKSPGNSTAHFALADLYGANGDLARAEDYYARGLRIQPDHGPALAALGMIQVRSGRPQEAERTFARLSATSDTRYTFVHAVYLFETGKRDAAIAEFARIAAQRSGDREARTYLISAYLASGRTNQAERLLTEAVDKNPKDADALLQRARIHLTRGKTDLAERDLQLAMQSQADSAEAHYLLSGVHQMRGQTRLQQQELAEALRLNPGHMPARVQLARVLRSTGDARGALDIIDGAPAEHKINPAVVVERNWALIETGREAEARDGLQGLLRADGNPEVVLQNAILQLRQGQIAAAKTGAEKALEQVPADLRALELVMYISAAEKRPADGLERVRRHAAQHAKLAPVQTYLARIELQAGNPDRARAALLAAKAAAPESTEADLMLSRLDLSAGKLEDARRRLVAIADAGDASARAILGLVEEKAGDYNAASDHYRAALELNPRDVAVLNNFAFILTEHAGRPDEALRYAQQAKELAPENPAVDDTLGWTYYRKGLYPMAVRHLEAAAKREPNARRRAHLAAAYAKNGNLPGAKSTLDAALRMDSNVPEAALARQAIAEQETRTP